MGYVPLMVSASVILTGLETNAIYLNVVKDVILKGGTVTNPRNACVVTIGMGHFVMSRLVLLTVVQLEDSA